MTVQHITIEQASILYTNAEPMLKLSNELIDKHNARIDKANAEQEQSLISADAARKLGAGKAEFQAGDGNWIVCEPIGGYDFPYEKRFYDNNEIIKYRAIKA